MKRAEESMEAQTVETPTGTYIYCVIATPKAAKDEPSFRASPIAGPSGEAARVRLVREGDLTAVVSDAPLIDYDPTRANVAAHEGVVGEALQRSAVLPMRFGTVAGNDDEVRRLLREKHDDLAQSLARVEGRAELGLKVLWDNDRIMSELLSEDGEIRELREAVRSRPEAQTYDQRVELGRLTVEALEKKRQEEADRILDQLRPLAVDVVVNRLLTDDMILNASFLVERGSIEALDAAVDALGSEQRGRLRFTYIGPLPPYNFVRIVVPKEED